jgi:hypothetical protein
MMRNRNVIGFIFFYFFAISAYAGSYGGYIIRTGSVDVHLDLKGVANPTTKPAINIVDGSLDQVEYLCVNPTNHNVAPGSAGQRTFSGSDVLDQGDIVGKGQGVVDMSFQVLAGTPSCVNPNWSYLPKSEVAKSVSLTSKWYACTGDPKIDADPCFEGNALTIEPKPIDTLQLVCGLSTVLRNGDGTAVPGQIYSCVKTSP